MASLNYMQTTTFKVFFRFFLLAMISVLLRLLHVCCMIWCIFHKGLYYEQKLKCACNIKDKGNLSCPISIYWRTIFSRGHFFAFKYSKKNPLRLISFETWNKWWSTTHKIRRGQCFPMSWVVWRNDIIFNGNHLLKKQPLIA